MVVYTLCFPWINRPLAFDPIAELVTCTSRGEVMERWYERLRGPAAILFISRDACSDSIAKLIGAFFPGLPLLAFLDFLSFILFAIFLAFWGGVFIFQGFRARKARKIAKGNKKKGNPKKQGVSGNWELGIVIGRQFGLTPNAIT